MKKKTCLSTKLSFLSLFIFFSVTLLSAQHSTIVNNNWKAKWISNRLIQNKTNTWTIALKSFHNQESISKAYIRMAVDSKYWLWLNGQMVVFEGGLKRGPDPFNTYYDQFDVSQYLKQGDNQISLLFQYFGKDGFSHLSSGKAGFIFELYINDSLSVVSDKDWFTYLHPSYFSGSITRQPNWRLSESNIVYDARLGDYNWYEIGYKPSKWIWSGTMEIGEAGCSPWNKLIKRPIPMWKDFGFKNYLKTTQKGDTIICDMPYNAQITPYFKINAKSGQLITIQTDNYVGGSEPNVKSEYVCKDGVQEYESLGWMNGHQMYFIMPKDITVIDLKYRETGYATEFNGSFESNDKEFNTLWQKSQRTLYITMRDNYMDCPDRERAQWAGDAINEIQESFYALCPQSHLLAKKFYHEVLDWQRADNTFFAPIPAGNWESELPTQMLNTIGYYGIYTYYLHTGDTAMLAKAMPKIKAYLSLWEMDKNGLVKHRAGGWDWGDWGKHIDMPVLENAWFYLALKAYNNSASELGNKAELAWSSQMMKTMNKNFNNTFWNGKEYRSSTHEGNTDDRANALAVLAGFAKPEYFKKLEIVFTQQLNASPYMERYITEAMFVIGSEDKAMQRLKSRFSKMINSDYTTLWEGWGIGTEGYGGGTYNHAWSGGGLITLSELVAGLSPKGVAYSAVQIKPYVSKELHTHIAKVHCVRGIINISNKYDLNKSIVQNIDSPSSTDLLIAKPLHNKLKKLSKVSINNVMIDKIELDKLNSNQHLKIKGGKHKIIYTF